MRADRNTLSPNEISKFIYCPYQWYYERVYGRKELERLARERNERLGFVDRRLSNFNRGYEYHNNVKFNFGITLKRALLILVVLAIVVIFVTLKVKNIV